MNTEICKEKKTKLDEKRPRFSEDKKHMEESKLTQQYRGS